MLAVGAGYGVGANAGAVMLAGENAGIWASVGVHPHDAAEWSVIAETALDGWLSHSRVVAVGECGLDYWYEHSPRDAQAEALRAQIRIARAVAKPLVIHVRPSRDTRDAFDEILAIFDDAGAERVGGVIHCFTGDLPFARECLARGFDISFSGILTFKQRRRAARGGQGAAARAPAGRDRLPAARAGSAPRPAQRAGLGRARGRVSRGAAREVGGRDRRAHRRARACRCSAWATRRERAAGARDRDRARGRLDRARALPRPAHDRDQVERDRPGHRRGSRARRAGARAHPRRAPAATAC